MERRLSISILNTETRSGGFLHRDYTVNLIQIYLFKILIDFSKEFTSYKRFSELHEFANTIKRRGEKKGIYLSEFPQKQLLTSSKIVNFRREVMQNWFRELCQCGRFEKKLCQFFNINFKVLHEKAPLIEADDKKVLEFIRSMDEEGKNRLSVFKSFVENFLARRRNLSKEIIQKLLMRIMPLCNEKVLGGLVLDFISKLTNREFYYNYEKAREEILVVPLAFIKCMHLEEYLLQKKHGDGQLQAYNLLNLFKTQSSDQSIHKNTITEILNNNTQAYELYENWDIWQNKKRPKSEILEIVRWNTMKSSEKIKCLYKYSKGQLEFDIELNVKGTKDRVLEVFTTPEERKKWDCKVCIIENTENEYFFEYKAGKCKFSLISALKVYEDERLTTILFEDKESRGLFSEVFLEQSVEDDKYSQKSYISNGNIRTAASEEIEINSKVLESLRIRYKIITTGDFVKVFKDDIIQESDDMISSLNRLVKMIENDGDSCSQYFEKKKGYFADACKRKYLRSTMEF